MIINVKRSKPLFETATYSIQESHQVKSFIVNRQQGVFGFEYYLDDMEKKLTFFVDHLSRTNLTPTRATRIDLNRANLSCYYLRFQKPNYAPFSFTNVDDLWILIHKYTQSHINKGIKIYIQSIFQYHSNESWKVVASEKYIGYLEGITNLSMNKHIQNLQYKIANIFNTEKQHPVDEAIEKLEQDGYSTCVRLVIAGNETLRKKVLGRIMLAFNTQRLINGWEFREVIHKKKFIADCQARAFPRRYKNQILCPAELNVFFGGEEARKENQSIEPIAKWIGENKPVLGTRA